ncbi:MerR family transcriptional regulator, partial [Streptomyces mirabilis]
PIGSDSPSLATRRVDLPSETIRAVQQLVGAENISAFVTASTEREVQSRTLEALAPSINKHE